MPSTQGAREQFRWDDDKLTHEPTRARFTLGSQFVNYGRTGSVLSNGDDFQREDVLKMAYQLVLEKSRR